MRIMHGAASRACRIAVSAAGVVVVASCGGSGPAQGSISGHLYMIGGPLPLSGATRSPEPVTGQVVAAGPAGTHSAAVGSDGRYTMHLPPGTYVVRGTSPNFNSGNSSCRGEDKVTVIRDQSRTVDVYCPVP
jgi:hypothetical protein